MKSIYLFQALICGAIISFIDLRSGEVQATALLVLATTFIFGLLHARRAWVYALIVGFCIVITHLLTRFISWPEPIDLPPANPLSGLIVLLPAFIGAYCGAGLRWVLDGLNESQRGQKKAS